MVGWADGWSGGQSVYGHVITKFSWMGSSPDFLTHGAPRCASRAIAPLLFYSLNFIGVKGLAIFQ